MKVIIRADSSSNIGTGHIMRDLVLATQFDDVTFVTRDLPGNINFKIRESGYSVEIVKDDSLSEFVKVFEKLTPDIVIIDSYSLNYNFERALKEKYPDIKLMVLDDTYEKHCCDILLNHNISANEKRYKNLVPDSCELRCGAKYTLLRKEFYRYKTESKQINQVPTVFVAMGGSDHSNINIPILEVIENIGGINANVVTTVANKNLEKLKEYCLDKSWIDLYVNSTKIARIMHESDFAIVSPSVTVNEVLFMELPVVAIMTADNQLDMYDYLKKNKYLVLERMDEYLLKANILKIIQEIS